MHSETFTIYQYKDLSDKAKEKAQEEIGQLRSEYGWTSDDIKDAIDYIVQDREGLKELKAYFSLNYCQGDGVAFQGMIRLNDEKSHVFQHVYEDCHESDSEFSERSLLGTTIKVRLRGHYTHENSMEIEYVSTDCESFEDAIEDSILEYLRNLSIECRDVGYAVIDDTSSDEFIVEFLENNEHLDRFQENGSRFLLMEK